MAASCCWCHQLPRCPSLRRTRPADFASSAATVAYGNARSSTASQPRPTSSSCSASWPSAAAISPSRRASWPSAEASRKELQRRPPQSTRGSFADRQRPGGSPSSGTAARPGPPLHNVTRWRPIPSPPSLLQGGQTSSSPRRSAVRETKNSARKNSAPACVARSGESRLTRRSRDTGSSESRLWNWIRESEIVYRRGKVLNSP